MSSNSTPRVVVTGMGALTALGTDVATTWDGLVSGRSGIARITQFDPSRLTTQIGGEVKDFDCSAVLDRKEQRRNDRYVQLALVAARQAMDQAGLPARLEGPEAERTGVIVGTGIGGIRTLAEQILLMGERGPDRMSPFLIPMAISNLAAGVISIVFGPQGPNFSVVSACATGGHAIGEAWEVIRRGDADVMLAGGTEATFHEALVGGFRARNLALSFGVLALLGTSALLVLASGRRASRLARQQMDFVAAVTHELRTPLTAIRSAGQNLSAGIVASPERVRWYGDMIEMEGSRLSETVARVLAFARIGSGKQEYARRPVNVADLVGMTLAGYQLVLAERGLRVETSVDAPLPPLSADGDALELALRNLLDNAVKYGADGGWVGVRATASPDGREILLTVSDRGRGVSRKDVPNLFEPFFRGEDASTGGVQGSGLGLAVVEHVALGHGGRVEVRTERGRGSDFTIHLPASPAGEGTEEST